MSAFIPLPPMIRRLIQGSQHHPGDVEGCGNFECVMEGFCSCIDPVEVSRKAKQKAEAQSIIMRLKAKRKK